MSTKYGYLSPQAQRRIQAGELILKGYGNNDIVEILDVSSASVWRWRTLIKEAGGLHGLVRKQGSGQSSTLTDGQSAELKEILNEGAVRAGYPVDCWTSKIVSDLLSGLLQTQVNPNLATIWS
jgi:transposase